jgi:hypothetical protein
LQSYLRNISTKSNQQDKYLLITLLFLGWSYEWNARGSSSWPPIFIVYSRLAVPCIYLFYYFLTTKTKSILFNSLRFYKIILLVIVVIAIIEKIEHNFFGIEMVWKDYYSFILLPFWGVIGFNVGQDETRALSLIRNLAVYGSIASLYSYIMIYLGLMIDSPFGPMYWPYRFIIIFGFFYFLSSFILNEQKEKYTILYLLASSMSVFMGFYKNTIVSVFIAFILLSILIFIKKIKINSKAIKYTVLFIVLLFVSFYFVDAKYIADFNDYIQNRWLHNVNYISTSNPFDDIDSFSAGRYRMWEKVLYLADQSIVLGYGLGNK